MLRRPDNDQFPDPSATVLVVDDTAGARLALSETLVHLGFDTLIATDGEAALTSIRDFHPDALITDLEMPGMDGEHLIQALKSSENPLLREMPIVVCSSNVPEATVEKLRQLGADAVVPKPFDVHLLAEIALRLF